MPKSRVEYCKSLNINNITGYIRVDVGKTISELDLALVGAKARLIRKKKN